ncbi:amino acid/amide ABC transporter substrate-binding protein, HAAT family [Flavobacterium fluvii]|uniref:Amino acid/amide ABC transporter substrate-binding protein, HAAT family n=1 Tax=Flavobacterium fluvii TaxID=468056 RepID=A0A1M5LK04_9FLAO|nr:LysM peptidoglycan-binding domain-containing protein [Flavobacterium fluvii]SHG65345.1 amino acid/amide ABC transporter substrate-binding protein, HAAT family [Flavobacterium fluvii]
MKYFITVCLAILVFSFNGFSQEKSITHKVGKGETIPQIAQKYNVTPYDIYKLNPDAQSGLKLNSVLIIPKKAGAATPSSAKATTQAKTHKVEPKETLFAIEKKYGVSDEDLKKANPDLEKLGLQIGQTLIIPSSTAPKTVVKTPEKPVYHVVLPKETKYSIAKQYGMTIEELEKRNPEIIPNLPIGYQLLIKGTAHQKDKIVAVEPQKETPKPVTPKAAPTINYVDYEVKPKETLYSLSKLSGLSQEEFIKLNPALANGVEVGMILKVPSTASMKQETKKTYTSLSNKNGSRKKLVLLIPFNLSKIEGDTINSTTTRLKKDKFLNMTLDFYSGALMAIDSAKTLGVNIDVKILDSQETKNSSNISGINQENNLETADAIIGPFYQNNVEKTAELLGKNNVPVISPLSKDIGNAYANLYQTIPANEVLKTAMFDYMRAKGGNMIAVVDKKKESVRQYIRENQSDVQFAPLLDNGSLSVEGLKGLFVKDKMNYVVMETANTVMIKWTMSTMMSALANYKVQLVILEPNETLDTDEINFVNLTKLKLMYPSVTRENESPEALIFEKEYRKKNKIAPSNYATRGFDVTFDTMMRLSQGKTYQETADTVATEQVDNKFEYYKKEGGGYTNKGVYILYYDTDLTIKEAN